MKEKNKYVLLRLKIILLILWRGKVSIKKLFNLGHSWLAHMTRLKKTSRLPFMMNFELWNECNAQCTFCRTKDGDIYNLNPETNPSLPITKGRMPLPLYQGIIDQVKDQLLIAVLYVNGEPLMYKDLGSAIRYASERKVATMIATNGALLSKDKIVELLDSNLDLIKIAITGFTQEIYTVQHRNTNIEKIKENLRNLARLKKKRRSGLIVMLDYILYDYNQHEKERVSELCAELGFIFNIRPGNHFKLEEERPDLIPDRLAPRPKLPIQELCEWPWQVMTINWNGDMLPCCDYVMWGGATPYATFEPGKTQVEEVWNGSVSVNYRLIHLTEGRKGIDICSQCPRTGTAFKY